METELHPDALTDTTANIPCCLGIDEAGRGPVLGPMVYGVAYCAITDKSALASMGFDDSKVLSEAQRENLFDKLKTRTKIPIGFAVDILDPESLSIQMLRVNKVNLNTISHNSAIGLIRKVLAKGVNLKEVFVDTVGTPSIYQAKLKNLFPDIEITVSKKADSLFPIVSAASICAKVIRDLSLKNWEFKEQNIEFGRNFGSGYPSDPSTKNWLKKNMDPVFGFPSVLRFSWKTTSNILNNGAVEVIWKEDEEDEFGENKSRNLPDRYRYFSENNMDVVADFE